MTGRAEKNRAGDEKPRVRACPKTAKMLDFWPIGRF